MANPLARDIDHILTHTEGLWRDVPDKRILVTGGTGFFGCWLLESFVGATEQLGLNASAVVLTRNPGAFVKKAPHLATHPAIEIHQGDIRSFEFPQGEFSHVVHAATESSANLNAEDPLTMFDTIVLGTRRTLEFARQCAGKFLLVSSGAVYGKQPTEINHIAEDYKGGPDPLDSHSAYGEGKRAAELLCSIYANQFALETKVARCFAFVGPYMPLDIHFAIGNFIRDGLRGGPIHVKGDGTPCRSYLYAADLAIWLWTILFRGTSCRPYNVGSEAAISIGSLADTVAGVFQPKCEVQIAKRAIPENPVDRYVPSTQRAQIELGLEVRVPLQEAIERTADWYAGRSVGAG